MFNMSQMMTDLQHGVVKTGQDLQVTQTKLSRYKLANDASLTDKLSYAFYRIWNAVKAIFNQSDWQCVQREMVKDAQDECKYLINAIPFAMLAIQSQMPMINECIEKGVIAANYAYVDGKLADSIKDSSKMTTVNKIAAKQIETIFNRFVDHIETSAGVNLKGKANHKRFDEIDPSKAANQTKAADPYKKSIMEVAQYVSIDEGIATALVNTMQNNPKAQQALMNIPFYQKLVNDLCKETLVDCEKNNLMEKETQVAVQSLVDTIIKTQKSFLNSPLGNMLLQFSGMALGGNVPGLPNGNMPGLSNGNLAGLLNGNIPGLPNGNLPGLTKGNVPGLTVTQDKLDAFAKWHLG